jgi:myo-inositol catabolism protein IolC
MSVGYDKLLYILPFDHRHSYGSEVFGFKEPMTPEQIAQVAASKQVIYDGFKKGVESGVAKDRAGILVDGEFGAAILRDAARQGFISAMSVEKSGQNEFDFEYADQYAAHLDEFKPTFAKVLVRYDPEGDPQLNQRQTARLKKLGDYCRRSGRLYMFELLVPAEPAQLQKVGGDKKVYDRDVRPGLMVRSIREMQEAGVDPDVWKIEGLDRQEDCVKIAEVARRDGRTKVGCIVLGRGEDEQKVVQWLQTAAPVEGFTGFAVGRSTFLEPILQLRNGKLSAMAASSEIARRYKKWVDVFEQARAGKEVIRRPVVALPR